MSKKKFLIEMHTDSSSGWRCFSIGFNCGGYLSRVERERGKSVVDDFPVVKAIYNNFLIF